MWTTRPLQKDYIENKTKGGFTALASVSGLSCVADRTYRKILLLYGGVYLSEHCVPVIR